MAREAQRPRRANKALKLILWVSQDGRCAICQDLLEDAEGDHLITFAEGGETRLDNLQLLCHPCHADKTHSDRLRLRQRQKEQAMGYATPSTMFVRRKGQQEWRDYIDAHPDQYIFPGRFPTGYGKTETILDGYDSLRMSRQHNRLLVIVPTDTQAMQYVNDLERKARRMGIALTGVVLADGSAAMLKYHHRNRAEVFVATVQRIVHAVKGMTRAGNWIADLLATGSWMGAADEYHHYANENGNGRGTTSLGWGEALRQLTSIRQWLAVSATPERKSGATIFGDPILNVSYEDGLAEGNVLKYVAIRIREYNIELETDQEPARRLTTTELREEIGTEDIDTWETRRQLRYLTQYSSPLLIHALAELSQLAIASTQLARPQMLIYTHSCAMAEALADLASALAPGFTVDWVGTGSHGRTEQENKAIITRFLDRYSDDGQITHPHTLDILVQVNIAGEGFDSKPVAVIVDLSLHGFGPQKLQQYGRGTRYYHGLPLVLYVPTDSAIARIAELKHGIFDLPVDTVIPSEPGSPTDPLDGNGLWPPLPKLQVIDAQLIGGQDYDPTPGQILGVAPAMSQLLSQRYGGPIELDPEHNPKDYTLIKDALTGYNRQTHQQQSTVNQKIFWQERVTMAVGSVAKRLVMMLYNGQFDKRIHAAYCTLLNKQYGEARGYTNVKTALDTDYRTKYNWLSDLDATLLGGDVPAWVPIYQ